MQCSKLLFCNFVSLSFPGEAKNGKCMLRKQKERCASSRACVNRLLGCAVAPRRSELTGTHSFAYQVSTGNFLAHS